MFASTSIQTVMRPSMGKKSESDREKKNMRKVSNIKISLQIWSWIFI